MSNSLWAPLVGIWVLGMLIAAVIVRTLNLRFWMTIAIDLAVCAVASIATLAGIATLAERSQDLLGVPSVWVFFAFCLAFLRVLLILKSLHERGKIRYAEDTSRDWGKRHVHEALQTPGIACPQNEGWDTTSARDNFG